jgi:hypothetical protein
VALIAPNRRHLSAGDGDAAGTAGGPGASHASRRRLPRQLPRQYGDLDHCDSARFLLLRSSSC